MRALPVALSTCWLFQAVVCQKLSVLGGALWLLRGMLLQAAAHYAVRLQRVRAAAAGCRLPLFLLLL